MYLFRLDNSTHEGQTLEMFSGTSTHRVEIDLPGSNLSNKPSIKPERTYDIRHFVDDFQTGTLAILFASLCIGVDNFIMELAHGLLQPTMALKKRIGAIMTREKLQHPYLLVIGAMVALR
jgi:hypothetical protein